MRIKLVVRVPAAIPATLSALILATCVGISGAVVYPPGPGGTCPDTLTILNLENPASSCHPASGDTVYGVRGVVTAIDSIAGAFGFYMQLQGGGPNSGIDVFTGGANYQSGLPGTPTGGNIFYGNLLAVDGRVLEFNGLTELSDFDNIQTTNDIIIRRISANNPFPPYHIGTCNELDWVPGWTSVNGTANPEPWEGCLVRVRGPLVCGRTVGTGIGTRSMLVTTPGGADTIAVDGFSLTNVAALAVGAPIDSVQGVLTQVIISAVPSYRILLRNSNDLFAAAPPNVIDAYSVQENVVRVVFDRTITLASAQNTNNYSLSSFGAIVSATLESGSKSVLVQVSGAAPHGTSETITVSGIVSTQGLAMSGSQFRSFIRGVLTIAEVQQPDATSTGLGGTPCYDHSRYVTPTGGSGPRLTYQGVVTAAFGSLFYMEDAAGGVRSGIAVFSPPSPLLMGHKYTLAGQVQEFDGISTTTPDGVTEGVNTQYLQDLGATSVPGPAVQAIHLLTDATCDASQTLVTAEDYEEVLVTVSNARVAENRPAGQSFLVAGPFPGYADTILISNAGGAYTYAADSAHTVSITGVLNWRNGASPWRLSPRSNADIVDFGILNHPPVLKTIHDQIAFPDRPFGLSAVATDADHDPLTWRVENAPGGFSINATSGRMSWTPTCQTGTFPCIRVIVTDSHNASDSACFTIFMKLRPIANCVRLWDQKVLGGPNDTNNNGVSDDLDAALATGDSVVGLVQLIDCDAATIPAIAQHAKILHVFKSIPVVCVKVKASGMDTVRRIPKVRWADVNHALAPALDTTVRTLQVRASSTYPDSSIEEQFPGIDGTGSLVAILDTGVDDGVHESLDQARLVPGSTTFDQGDGSQNGANPNDIDGHGSFNAGIAIGKGNALGQHRGVAPGASYVDIRIINKNVFTNQLLAAEADVIAALEYCEAQFGSGTIVLIGIAGNALGYNSNITWNGSNPGDNLSPAIKAATEAGLTVIVPVGNDGPANTKLYPPAVADGAITVGSSAHMNSVRWDDDVIANSSSSGPRASDGDMDPFDEQKPDIVAPGTDLPSGGAGIISVKRGAGNLFIGGSGTSAAAAHVAGVVALLRQWDPSLDPQATRQVLIGSVDTSATFPPALAKLTSAYGVRQTTAAWGPRWGNGLINAYNALNRREPQTYIGFAQPLCSENFYSTDVNPIDFLIYNQDAHIRCRVTNFGNRIARRVEVELGAYYFGDESYHRVIRKDTVTVQPNSTTEYIVTWHVDVVWHGCLKLKVAYAQNSNVNCLEAQHNVDVAPSASPAHFSMWVGNLLDETSQVTLIPTLVSGSNWTLSSPNKPTLTFSLANGAPAESVAIDLTPGAGASDTCTMDVRVSQSGACGTQVVGGCRLTAYHAVLDVPAPAGSHQPLTLAPSPFNRELAISFGNLKRQQIAIEVYDVAGRRVKRVALGSRLPGPVSAVWDGTDDRANVVPAGLYFIRVNGERRLFSGHVMRLP